MVVKKKTAKVEAVVLDEENLHKLIGKLSSLMLWLLKTQRHANPIGAAQNYKCTELFQTRCVYLPLHDVCQFFNV